MKVSARFMPGLKPSRGFLQHAPDPKRSLPDMRTKSFRSKGGLGLDGSLGFKAFIILEGCFLPATVHGLT